MVDHKTPYDKVIRARQTDRSPEVRLWEVRGTHGNVLGKALIPTESEPINRRSENPKTRGVGSD